MKKFLALLTVLVLLSSSVFAVTSVTKENSQDGYPGVLTKGSISGTSTFIADMPLLANTVMFEYAGAIFGMAAIKTDFGILGISVSPSALTPTVSGITANGVDTFGLQYGTELSGMGLGASLLIGNDSWSYKNDDIVANAAATGSADGYDVENYTDSYYGLKLGAALRGNMPIDVALGVTMDNSYERGKDYNNVANGVVVADNTIDNSKLGFELSGRVGLGKDLLAVLGVVYAMGSEKATDLTYNTAGTKLTETITLLTNNYFEVDALIGKDIKATESLTIKIASGLMVNTNQDTLTKTESILPVAPVAYSTGPRWSELVLSIPLNVAVEGKLNDTWSINAGASATLLSSDNETWKNNVAAASNDPDPRYSRGWLDINPTLGYSVGVTGKIGDLQIDLNLNPMILINGPYLISGQTTGTMVADLALVYGWK